jgi:hypothetical protein
MNVLFCFAGEIRKKFFGRRKKAEKLAYVFAVELCCFCADDFKMSSVNICPHRK